MNNKVLAAVIVVVVVIAAAAAALVMSGGDDEEGTVTTGVNYHGNGGTTSSGGTVYGFTETTVQVNRFTYEGRVFTGWNTLADGTGTSYQQGDGISYGSGTVDLYAQWSYALTIDVLTSGSLTLLGSLTMYLIGGSGDYSKISAFGTDGIALPSEGAAALAIHVDGVSEWTVDGDALVATGSDGGT